MKKKRKALVLQGGGALGAYEYGVIKALYEQKDFSPSVVTGVSIGAINASVLVGAKGDPVGTLGHLWERLTVMDVPFMPKVFQQSLSLFGNMSMYRIRPDFAFSPLLATSVYDTSPLYKELEDLIDLEKLNSAMIWLVITAVDIETGKLKEFENRNKQQISFDHIVASGSLPPGFPMTKIGEKSYWDGGLFSNTPLRIAINCLERLDGDDSEVERELIVVELFPKESKVPGNMMEVSDRMVELIFSNKLGLDEKLFKNIDSYIDLIRLMDKELPEDSSIRKLPAFQELMKHKKIDKFTVIQHLELEPVSAPNDFSKSSITRRIEAGYRDAIKQL